VTEDIYSRGAALAATTIISRLFYVLHEKNLLTAPEIDQVILDAERSLAHHVNPAALAAKGILATIRDWANKPPP